MRTGAKCACGGESFEQAVVATVDGGVLVLKCTQCGLVAGVIADQKMIELLAQQKAILEQLASKLQS
jgi:uncharacterized Zn finger protein